jgi:hypothetical protein
MSFSMTGYQTTDGNLNEPVLGVQQTPVALGAGNATLTPAQLVNGLILGSPGTSAAAYTLPLASDLNNLLRPAKPGTSFDFSVINVNGSSSGVITMTTNTGWTIGTSGSQGLMTVAATAGTVRRFRAVKTSATAWALYAIT